MSKPADHDLVTTLKKIRYDLTACQAKLTDALNLAAKLELPTPQQHTCPHCQLDLRGPLKLAEHLYASHDGPLPDHWHDAEARAADNEAAAA